MFKTIFARFGQIKAGKFVDEETGEDLNDIAKVLSQFGIALYDAKGEMNDVGNILSTLANKWDALNDTERNALATAIAGTRQRENFLVLMENYGKAVEYTEDALNSAGTAEEKFGAYSEGIEAKLNELKAIAEDFARKILDSDLVKNVIDGLTSAVGFLADNVWILKGAVASLMALAILKTVTLLGRGFQTLILRANNFTTATMGMQGAIRGVTAGTFTATTATNIFNQSMAMLGMTTTGVTAKEAIRQLKMTGLWNTIQGLDFATKQQILTMMGYDAQVVKEILKTGAWSTANITLSGTFKGLGAAIKGMMASNPIGWIMLAISVVIELCMWIGSLTEDTEELAEAALDLGTLAENLKTAKTEAEEAAKALEENLKAIKELQSKDTLTYVEDKELEKLKQATQELRWQNQIQQENAKKAGMEYLTEFSKTYSKNFGRLRVYGEEGSRPLPMSYAKKATEDDYTVVEDEIVDPYLKGEEGAERPDAIRIAQAYNHYTQLLNSLYRQGASKDIIDMFEANYIQPISSLARDELQTMQEYIDYVTNLSEDEKIRLIGADWEEDLEAAITTRDLILMTLDPDTYEKLKFTELLDMEGLEEIKALIGDVGFEGDLTAHTLKQILGEKGYGELKKKLESANLSIETFIDWLNSQVDVGEKVSQNIIAIKEEIEKLKATYTTLSDSIEEYNNQGYFTFDTMQKILDLGTEYIGFLIDENGNIKENTKVLEDYLRLKLQEQAYQQAINYVQSFTNKTEEEAIKIIQGQTLATKGVTQANLEFLASQIGLLHISLELKEKILEQSLALIQYAGNASFASDSTNKAKKASEEWEQVLDYANKVLDDHIDKLEKEREAIEKNIEEQIKAKEKEIELLEAEKEALEDKNEEKNKEIELEELQRNLQKAKQRTMRVYRAELDTWVWEQDPEALQEAQQELDDFYTEQKIDNIDKQIEALEKEVETLEKTTDDEEETYDERLKLLDEQIKKAEEYKQKWNSVKTDYEFAQNEIVAKAQLGADAEKKILMGADGKGGRLKVLEDFKTGYTKALGAVAKETENTATNVNTTLNKMIPSLQDLLKLSAISGVSEADAIVSNLTKVQGEKSGEYYYRDRHNNYYKASDVEFKGTGVQGDTYFIPKGTTMYSTPYASGTLSAKSGLANVDEKGNELIVPKQGRYRMMEYGDTVVPHNLSQRLFEVASNPLRFIANALNSVKSPNLMTSSNQTSNQSIIHIGTVELPSVTNGENFIKQLQLIAANR